MKLRVRNTKAAAVPWVCGLMILLSSAKAEGPAPEFSAPLSEEALFARCYRLLTRMELAPDHPLLIRVQQQHQSAADACMEIFDQATLSLSESAEPSGAKILSLENPTDELQTQEAKAILENFEEHFTSWFSTRDWSTVPDGFLRSRGLLNVLDQTEESLHLLRVLFGTHSEGLRYPFKNVVLSADSLLGMRTHPSRIPTSECKNYMAGPCFAQLPEWGNHQGASTSPGVGELLGMRVFQAEHPHHFYTRAGIPISSLTVHFGGRKNIAVNSPRANAGGILGLRSFLSKNAQFQTFSNGGYYARRRWAKEVFESLLCRPLPLLRGEDAGALVDGGTLGGVDGGAVTGFNQLSPQPSAAQRERVPFRSNATCMSCHGALDSLAGTIRGFHIAGVTRGGVGDYNSDGASDNNDAIMMGRMAPPELPSAGVPIHLTLGHEVNLKNANDPGGWNSFSKLPPEGLLLYRNYKGDLVNRKIQPLSGSDDPTSWDGDNGLAALGKALSEGDDLYVCAASRLVEHFTGVRANLADPGASTSADPTSEDLKIRQWIEELALHPTTGLKSTQNLRGLIYQIFKSDQFRGHGFRTLEEQP